MFENGRTDIDDAERKGRPSTATNSEIAARVNECILTNRRKTIDEISNEQDIFHGSVHKIIADHLIFRKVCARWVPRLLTEEHKASEGTAIRHQKGFSPGNAYVLSKRPCSESRRNFTRVEEKHQTIGLIGRATRLPCDVLFDSPPDTPSSPEEYVQDL
ncbi:uncharacterized protein LOC118193925 [Stegodyphus dumicola]|uniref:uncharacterized protein LOC118193925 n=1 Tax=Stegodyphus dumicola TaxID=202533 RepID=UPI0015AFA0EE|nr:uncharacterized protein LOC118193925 [Stegodyphus dumicola]